MRQGDPRIVQLGALVGVPARACFATRVKPEKLRHEGVTAHILVGKKPARGSRRASREGPDLV